MDLEDDKHQHEEQNITDVEVFSEENNSPNSNLDTSNVDLEDDKHQHEEQNITDVEDLENSEINQTNDGYDGVQGVADDDETGTKRKFVSEEAIISKKLKMEK